jgi:catechol 2,3-dioxygenase-like lactoylglutathione lyase family enzyme
MIPSMRITLATIRMAALSVLALCVATSAPAQSTAENPMQVVAPRTVTMVVADLDKEVAWYHTILGFRDTKKFGQGTPNPNATDRVARIELLGFRLDLVWHKGSTRPPAPEKYQEGWDHISFETTAMDDDYKWLTDHGIAIDAVRDKKTNALKIMRFHDPEGNEIHVESPN